jgi:hypothetical protein
MQKYLRSTRRGWMIFTSPDAGGASGAAADPPPAAAPLPQAGDATSKSIFNQSRIDAGLDQPPADTTVVASAVTSGKESDDAPPPAKSSIPEDVLEPDKSASAASHHDAVAEIQSAELPKGAKKEQIDSFGKLKDKAAKHLQAALDRAAELEREIKKNTQSGSDLTGLQEKLAAAQKKAADVEEQFAKVAYEKSPKFQAQFTEQENTAIELAKSYLDGTDVKQDIIDLAARATGRKRIEILKDAGLDDTSITAIMPHLASFDTIQRNKQTALTNWKVISTQEREEAQRAEASAKAARTEQENKVWETVLSKSDLLPLRKSKDNAEWNTRAEALVTEAKQIFNGDGADLPKFAETILKGRAYDVQQEVLDHLRGENQSLRAENARLKSAAPGGIITAGTPDGAPVDTSKMTREEVAKSTFNAEKAKAGA